MSMWGDAGTEWWNWLGGKGRLPGRRSRMVLGGALGVVAVVAVAAALALSSSPAKPVAGGRPPTASAVQVPFTSPAVTVPTPTTPPTPTPTPTTGSRAKGGGGQNNPAGHPLHRPGQGSPSLVALVQHRHPGVGGQAASAGGRRHGPLRRHQRPARPRTRLPSAG
jgi:hypothetical protein